MRFSVLPFLLLLCHPAAILTPVAAADECENPAEEVCVYDDHDPTLKDFGPCPVDNEALTDYEAYDLSNYKTIWKNEMAGVPSITEDCAEGTPKSCQRGPINWVGKTVVLDTDLENEVDDYLAVAWALLSSVGESKQINLAAIVAAPFSFRQRFLPLVTAQMLYQQDQKHRECSSTDLSTEEAEACENSCPLTSSERQFLYGPPGSPGSGKISSLIRLQDVGVNPKIMIERNNHATWCPDVGMEKSYQGLVRFVNLFGKAEASNVAIDFSSIADTPVFRGEAKYVMGRDLSLRTNFASEGVSEIIRLAREAPDGEPIYVVALGAPTNVAAALLIAPEIVSKIVVAWDATWGFENRERVVTGSLNFEEDLVASRIMLESQVRMLYFPGFPSGQTLQLSHPEAKEWFKGQGIVSDAIYQRYNNNPDTQFSGLGFGRYSNAGTTRVMWDIGNLVPFIIPGLLSVQAIAPPMLQRVKTVRGCNGYASIGTTCEAEYPTGGTYKCHAIDPYNLEQCNDGFFVDWDENEPEPKDLVQAMMMGGLSGPGGSGIDLLHKLQAAGL